MARGPRAEVMLAQALTASAAAAGCPLSLGPIAVRDWADGLFVGARHRVTLCAADDARYRAWLAQLPDDELPLRGHFVRDLAVISQAIAGDQRAATIEVLTIADA